MDEAEARAALDRLIRDRGESRAALSKMLGRNAAYLQQYLERGTPRRLDEGDRRTLAAYFGVAEARLGGPAAPAVVAAEQADWRDPDALVLVPRHDVVASAGPGAVSQTEAALPRVAFRAGWLKRLARGTPTSLAMIRVEGESMLPTLKPGDEILLDRSDGRANLRDGLYVLRAEDRLSVKRVAIGAGRGIAVLSDNPAFPPWDGFDPAEVEVVGRVLWSGGRL